LLSGDVSSRVIIGVLVVKSVIWSVSLGSGTSGGVLAPLLMMGGALGGVESWFFPGAGVGFWPLVSMGAILGGTMRSPLTGVVFAIELTHDINMILPLLVAVTIAHAFTVLVLKRSILTEKIARRGYHLSREYAVDALEILFVREVMRTSVAALPADAPYDLLRRSLHGDARGRQRLYPVIGERQALVGVITRRDLQTLADAGPAQAPAPLAAIIKQEPIVAYPDESLRMIVYRMAETGLTRFPVIDRGTRQLLGMVALTDLLKARALNLDAEQRRERVLGARITLPFRRQRVDQATNKRAS
jgi:chloride channel protein, CIC family